MQDDEPKEGDQIDAKLREFADMFGNKISPEEIGQALMIVFEALAMLKQEVDEELDARGRSGDERFQKLQEQLGADEKERSTAIARLNRLIDGLYQWKAELDARTTEDDLTVALEDIAENSKAIRIIRRELKKLTGKPPKNGAPGKPPAHEWNGTMIRFQNPDGSWGEWKNLQGPPGEAHPGGGTGSTQDLRAGSSNVSIRNGRIYVESSGTGGGHVIQDEGSDMTQRTNLNFVGAGVSVSDDLANDRTTITIPGASGGGLSAKTEVLAGAQNGANVELTLSGLSETYVGILGVYRNGQLLTPTTSWTLAAGVITVLNADAGEDFQISYTYSSSGESFALEVLAGSQNGVDVELDLSGLTHAYTAVLGVYRNGQLLTPTTSWAKVGDIATVYNADSGEDYQVGYTY